MKLSTILIAAASAAVVLSCCGRKASSLERVAPESVGVDTTEFHKVWDRVWGRPCDELHALMVLKDGKIVYERYSPEMTKETRHVLWSASKTFTATAAGFAVQDGLLDVNDKVVSFFSEDELPCKDSLSAEDYARLQDMTVANLLTMSSGFRNDIIWSLLNLTEKGYSWVKAALAEPVTWTPGSKFAYNSINTFLVSVIVSKVTGMRMDKYLEGKLFKPLGITDWHWDLSPDGYPTGGWGLFLNTESFAKMGQFLLQKGVWNGNRLLNEEWIDEMTSAQIMQDPDATEFTDGNSGYGYQVWRCRHDSYRLDGAYGQFCVEIPEKNAVVAIFEFSHDAGRTLDGLWEFIYPAL